MFSLICSCFNPRTQKNLDSKTDCKICFSLILASMLSFIDFIYIMQPDLDDIIHI